MKNGVVCQASTAGKNRAKCTSLLIIIMLFLKSVLEDYKEGVNVILYTLRQVKS
jgi:hypothetical protein